MKQKEILVKTACLIPRVTYKSTHVAPIDEEKRFDFFFREYYVSLCFFANSILHDVEAAKDLVQDCYVKLWNSHTIAERADTVKSFLYTAVRNKCLDFLRKKKVIDKAELQLTKDDNDSDFEYFDEVAFAEMMRQLIDHIDKLPSNMTTILKKYYLQGKKHKEIAMELGTTPNAIQLQKARAIKLLKQKLLFFMSLVTCFLLALCIC